MNRIVLTGDTHGTLDVEKIRRFQQGADKLDESDYLIICGDAGIVWDEDTLAESINVYQSFETNILFVDGNHENFDLLKTFKATMWKGGKVHRIADNVFHLMRGQVFELCGKELLTLGGADSTDKENRVEHISWWKEETFDAMDVVDAMENLKKHDYKVDYVISHSPNNECLDLLYKLFTQCGESVPYYLEKKLKYSTSSSNLQEIKDKITFKKWFCGHIHIDEFVGEYRVLYNDFEEI